MRRFSSCLFVSILVLSAACSSGGGAAPLPNAPRLSFAPPQRFALGVAGAMRLQFADLDRNGQPDALTTNRFAGSITVLPGVGSGLFSSSSTYTASSSVAAVATADLDGDRIVDLVDGSTLQPRILVRRNDGAGTLTVTANLQLSQPCRDLLLAELTLDGKPDLVVAGATSDELLVLPGDGSLGFGAEIALAVPAAPRSLLAVDCSGDAQLDLVAIVNHGTQIAMLRSAGAGVFAPPVLTDVPLLGSQLAALDANRDGRTDLVAVRDPGTSVEVLLGNGAGAFARGTPVTVPDPVAGIAAADLDNDGLVDLLLAAGKVVYVAYGDGQGSFSALETVAIDAADCTGLAVADLDADGQIDVAYLSGGNFLVRLINPELLPLGVTPYGRGTPDCLGAIGMLTSGRASLGSADFAYNVTNAPPGSLGMLMLGGPAVDPGVDAFGLGFLMHVGFDLLITNVLVSDVNGASRIAAPVPASAGIVGLEVFVQSLWVPVAGRGCSRSSVGISTSRGLEVVVQGS